MWSQIYFFVSKKILGPWDFFPILEIIKKESQMGYYNTRALELLNLRNFLMKSTYIHLNLIKQIQYFVKVKIDWAFIEIP